MDVNSPIMCTAVRSSCAGAAVLLLVSLLLPPFSTSEAPLGGAVEAAETAAVEVAAVAGMLWCCVSFDNLIVVPVVLCSS